MMRDKPETPPSAVAAAPPSTQPFKEALKEMLANKNFLLLTIGYALTYGIYCTVGSTISNLLHPFGFSPSEISIAGGSCMLSGVIGALLIGLYVDHTSLYRRTHLILGFMVIVSIFMVAYVLTHSNGELLPILASTIVFGISGVSFFPVALSYGAELTFPLQPALVNATMNFTG